MEAVEKQKKRAGGVWARLWRASRRKRAPDPSIAAVMAQWAEYELIFNDILQRLNAQLARQAKMEKKALERLTQENGADPADPSAPVPVLLTPKQTLRSAWAAQRYGGLVRSLVESKEARE